MKHTTHKAADPHFTASQKKAKQLIVSKDKAAAERAAKTARLKALRLAQEEANRKN